MDPILCFLCFISCFFFSFFSCVAVILAKQAYFGLFTSHHDANLLFPVQLHSFPQKFKFYKTFKLFIFFFFLFFLFSSMFLFGSEVEGDLFLLLWTFFCAVLWRSPSIWQRCLTSCKHLLIEVKKGFLVFKGIPSTA